MPEGLEPTPLFQLGVSGGVMRAPAAQGLGLKNLTDANKINAG